MGTARLSQKLFNPYSADISFVSTNLNDNSQIKGTAHVEKGEKLVVDILSPSEFEGITLESEYGQQNEVMSLVYSGIKTSLDSSIFSKIDLALSLAGDTLAQNVENAPKDAVTKCEEKFELVGVNDPQPYIINVKQDEKVYTIVYDRQSGTPFVLKAQNGNFDIAVKIEKIKYKEN